MMMATLATFIENPVANFFFFSCLPWLPEGIKKFAFSNNHSPHIEGTRNRKQVSLDRVLS